MTAACLCLAPSQTDATAPDADRPEHNENPPLDLAQILDLQEAEVPGTAGAFQHFFSDV
ncbi:hypothetical protein [Streptomyces lushanensis]|uniref:hypothetical protein n=1 Tax=Streptomyces lushanensis TaxID=1434255 RepID=UPI001474A058|nr:hypothetical protein [Streptomyces lushanensis]